MPTVKRSSARHINFHKRCQTGRRRGTQPADQEWLGARILTIPRGIGKITASSSSAQVRGSHIMLRSRGSHVFFCVLGGVGKSCLTGEAP